MDALKEQLIEVGRDFGRKGWVPGTCGNLSARIGGDRILITRSGSPKARLTDADFAVFDVRTGAAVTGEPSSEVAVHRAVYEMFPDVGSVLHIHAPAATCASFRPEAVDVSGFESVKIFPGVEDHDEDVRIPVFQNLVDVESQAVEVRRYYRAHPGAPPAFLTRGHGANAYGADVREARAFLEVVEYLCDCQVRLGRVP